MLEAVTLDQLRIFIAAAEAGSFSAAARRLKRAQSVISQSLANLEDQLGVVLFDRTGRMPVLTEQGRALIEEARAVAASMDSFKARAKGLAGGLEPELSVVVDVMFPIGLLTAAVSAFHTHFPNTPLRLYVEALGAVLQPVLDGSCAFGIMGSLPTAPAQMVMERLLTVRMVIVAAASHPLSAHNAPIPNAAFAHHVQLVLTDRSALSEGREFSVLSPKTWRLADLGAKHAFLLAGLGFGGMPFNAVQADLARGDLVKLAPEDWPADDIMMPMSAVYPAGAPPGPAGRWLIERLAAETENCPAHR
jgi:DNA-binding transcriptional LysR family regulator